MTKLKNSVSEIINDEINTILQKSFTKNSTPAHKEASLYIICNDAKNPDYASSFMFSREDIKKLTTLGFTINASPHIGKLWASNNFYKEMGVKISVFTGNQSIKDYCDEPENILINGISHKVSVQNNAVLSPYLITDEQKVKSILNNHIPITSSLARLHYYTKSQVIGSENIFLDTEMLEYPFFREMVVALIENEKLIYQDSGTIFDRFVTKNGEVLKNTKSYLSSQDIYESFFNLKKSHEDLVTKDLSSSCCEGCIPRVELWIILDAIYTWLSKPNVLNGVGNTFTVSGVDMVYYLKNKEKRKILDTMYTIIRDTIPELELPPKMRFFVLPGGLMKFYPVRQEKLYSLVVDILDKRDEFLMIKESFRTTDGQKPFEEMKRAQYELKNAKDAFKKAYNERIPFSQYDIIQNDLKFCSFLVERLMKISFKEIETLFATI